MGVYGSDNTGGLLLTEKAGAWSVAAEAVLPADAATTNQYVSIRDISCPSAGNCSAVGGYADSSGVGEGLLLDETAGIWSTGIEASLPANYNPHQAGGLYGSPSVNLTSVSCGSPGNCVAVGAYPAGDTDIQGVLLTETGGIWSAGVEAPLPANAAATEQNAGLESVSCASAGSCTAVGSYWDASADGQGLLLTGSAGSWTAEQAALPADVDPTHPSVYLGSVACASAGNCSAIGTYTGSFGLDAGLLLNETSGTWSAGVKVSLPANAATTDFTGLVGPFSVSCPSAGNCAAVSAYDDSAGDEQGLLLTESAGSWAAGQEAALPPDAVGAINGAALNSVSCASAGNCTAVGGYTNSAGVGEGVLVTETAGSWTTGVRVAVPANADAAKSDTLNAVSCPAAGSCSAAGSYDDVTDLQQGLLTGGTAPVVKLKISRTGTGSGRVSSRPAGIRCGSTCSTSFDSGTLLRLTATPSAGSRFSGWSGGGCRREGRCEVNMAIADQTVKATFTLLPKCVVPELRGKTLRTAKHLIGSHHCSVGKIAHATPGKIKPGHVISQRPGPGRRLKHGTRVDLVVSKGRL